jgi:hypothetical protein
MQRIINGSLFESSIVPDSWDVRTFRVNGHTEISARNSVVWHEAGTALEHARSGDGYQGAPTPENLAKWALQDSLDAAERKEHCLKKSATRAKSMCRRVIKSEAFDELLTLTYRENQTDRELCKKHFAEWFRRMKKALGGFRFCASFEMQKRGAMHIHCATHKLPKMANYKGVKVKAWEVGTRIWRDIIGDFPFCGPLLPGGSWPKVANGLCFVGGRSKFGTPMRRGQMSTGRMASYVSKYILKDFEESPEEKNRYSRSQGTDVPRSELVRWDNVSLAELIGLVFELGEGDVVIAHSLGPWQESYWLVTEPGLCAKTTV